jgi:hypothetical protein
MGPMASPDDELRPFDLQVSGLPRTRAAHLHLSYVLIQLSSSSMSELGKVRIGHKAPDFRCDAVINGLIEGPYNQSQPILPTSILVLTFNQKSLSVATSLPSNLSGSSSSSSPPLSVLTAQTKFSPSRATSISSGPEIAVSFSSVLILSTCSGTGRTCRSNMVDWDKPTSRY